MQPDLTVVTGCAGAVVLLLVALLLKAPWRKSKQSPLLKVYRHD